MDDPPVHPYQSPSSLDDSYSALTREEIENYEWPVSEQVVLTAEDYMQFTPGAQSPNRSVRLAMFVLASILIIGAYRSGDVSSAYKGPLAMAVVLLILAALGPTRFIMRMSLKRSLKRMKVADQAITYQLSPTELCMVHEYHETRMRWEAIKWWRERDGLILAYWSEKLFIPFPIARFSSLGVRALRAFLDPQKRIEP